ncbi:helix-turn-helix domain-containing protein [Rhizobium sp. N4311]|uniref:helix-turn-helix domain-containing protein n=1 Tax=Rhizobium sp. N4311 TaxID=1703972 RepID=UPI000B96E43E|nr:helix-turn-helix domain-containing protein [Rhizobium sp. N4311]OYD05784.1 helix-turn-helix domain-containing protein [Rhizobium sp. N4311]
MSIKVMSIVWSRAPVQSGDLLMLLALADNADDNGVAFPSVTYLASKARMSQRNVQRCLRSLEGAGYIQIIERGGPSGSNKYRVNLKLLRDLPDEYVTTKRDDGETGGDVGVTPTICQGDVGVTGGVTPASRGGDVGVTLTVIEPPLEPSSLSAGRERGSDDVSDGKSVKRAFQRLVNAWPGFEGLSLVSAEREFCKLSAEDRDAALRMRDPWLSLLRKNGKDHTPAPSTYLRERLWEAVPQQQPSECAHVVAPAFGKQWTVHLLRLLATAPIEPPAPPAFIQKLIAAGGAAGHRAALERLATYGWPRANDMLQRAAEGKGMNLSSQEAQVDLPEMHAVAVDAPMFHQWRAAFDERGWPWLKLPRGVAFVWFPVDGHAAMQSAGPPEQKAQSG